MFFLKTADKAVSVIIAYAKDDRHGYDQTNRWGPDFDCSSLVIRSYEEAGVPVKSRGASYTGNMVGIFRDCGFVCVTDMIDLRSGAGLLPGDVLLNTASHAAMYIGDGKLAQARINELGAVRGGKPGDQTGREIAIGGYYNYPWDCVLRYKEAGGIEPAVPKEADDMKLRVLRRGHRGEDVRAAQILLIGRGCDLGKWGADGDFGSATYEGAVLFQALMGLEPDGEIGPLTWAKLLGVS